MPDYVYADDDPLDVSDPEGLAGVPIACRSSSYMASALHAAGCAQQAAQEQQHQRAMAVLWAPANFLLLDPLRDAFGPNRSVLQRGLGALALLPFVGMVARGVGLLGDALYAVRAGSAVDDAGGAVLSIAGGAGAGPARAPIFADNNLLVAAAEGNHAGALAEIRAGQTFITPNQFNEFLDVATSAQRTARRAFLDAQNIRVFGGPQAGVLASSSEFQDTFLQVAAQQGRDDAALAAFARVTGFQAVTMERRLYNFLTQTLPQLGVPIRRIY